MASKKSGNSGSATGGNSGGLPPGATNGADRNSLQKARPLSRAPQEDRVPSAERADRPAPTLNSIRPVRERVAATAASADAEKKEAREAERKKPRPENAPEAKPLVSAAEPDRLAVPEPVRKRFVQVGRKYYFPDGAKAFTDRGHRLVTASENTEVIKSLVSIAEARGWQQVAVRGTERFRREAWFAGRLAGLEVRGYRATEFEQGRLVRMIAERSGRDAPGPQGSERRPAARAGAAKAPGAERQAPEAVLAGRLIDHGRAPYKQDPKEPMSYYVKLETERGERVIWGVDLERAFKESLTQPKAGDAIGLRAASQQAVTVKAPQRDAQGQVVGEKDLQTHRNRWIVEKSEFFDARAQAARTLLDESIAPKAAVKAHPELVGTYLQVRAAELAAKRLRDPEDRTRFVSRVRSALAEAVGRGEPLPPVRLKEKTLARPAPRRVPEPAPVRG